MLTPFFHMDSETKKRKPLVSGYNLVVWGWHSTKTKCHWSWSHRTHAVWENFKGPVPLTWQDPAKERYLNTLYIRLEMRYFKITTNFKHERHIDVHVWGSSTVGCFSVIKIQMYQAYSCLTILPRQEKNWKDAQYFASVFKMLSKYKKKSHRDLLRIWYLIMHGAVLCWTFFLVS